MRINKFVAQGTGLSRRAADWAINQGRITINGRPAVLGDSVGIADRVTLDNITITPPVKTQTIMLHKPPGYVCSRDGQGSRTIYDLLPPELHHLKPVGRLDKDSSGLLLLTNDGDLANQLTHPGYAKTKIYLVTLDKPLTPTDHKIITGHGVTLQDGVSRLQLDPLNHGPVNFRNPNPQSKSDLSTASGLTSKPSLHTHTSPQPSRAWRVTMAEGRNRQIRRTFAALGYQVTTLHRTHFGDYRLRDLKSGNFIA